MDNRGGLKKRVKNRIRLKLKYILLALTSMVFAFFWVSCGGEAKTSREVQKERTREQINQRFAEIEPLVGDYEGTLSDEKAKRDRRIRIHVNLVGEPYEGDNVPDETTAPTLSANVLYYSQEQNSDNYIVVSFTRSDYDSKTKRLFLSSENKENSITGNFDEDELKGRWTNNTKGLIGTFRVRKITH